MRGGMDGLVVYIPEGKTPHDGMVGHAYQGLQRVTVRAGDERPIATDGYGNVWARGLDGTWTQVATTSGGDNGS